MRMGSGFDKVARAAMHCEQLLPRSAVASDGPSAFTRLAESVAAAFAPKLANLFGAEIRSLGASDAETMFPSALGEMLGKRAGNIQLPVGDRGNRLFASFPLPALVAELNRMFGGEATAEPEDPSDLQGLPSSLALLLQKLEQLLVEAIGECLAPGIIDGEQPGRIEADFAALAPFPSHGLVSVAEVGFATGGKKDLKLLLACRKSALGRLLDHWQMRGASATAVRRVLTPAMAKVEIPMRARLVDMVVPASRVAGLAPGDVLPISVVRNVPMLVGETCICTGSVGDVDDRAALQVQTITYNGEAA